MGWIRGMYGNPVLHRPDHILPDSEDAAKFRINVKEMERHSSSETRSQSVQLHVDDVAAAGQEAITASASFMSSDRGSSDNGGAPKEVEIEILKTPEQIADEEQERQRKLKEKKEEASKPVARCRRWLAACPRTMEKVEKVIVEIPLNNIVPGQKKKELLDSISASSEKLKDMRATLQAGLAQQQITQERHLWEFENISWDLDDGVWNLELGRWSLERGAWNQEFGTGSWISELGPWSFVLGILNLPPRTQIAPPPS